MTCITLQQSASIRWTASLKMVHDGEQHLRGGRAGDWGGSRARPISHKRDAAATVVSALQNGLTDSHSRQATRSIGKPIAPAVGSRIRPSAIVGALQTSGPCKRLKLLKMTFLCTL